MTDGPDLELQGAVAALLKPDATLQALLGSPIRLYEDIAQGQWPGSYVTIGESQVLDASDQCSASVQVYLNLHAWSRESGFADVKKIAAMLKSLLHNASLSLSENRCFSIVFQSMTPQRDPDGVTKHIAMTFKARIETAI